MASSSKVKRASESMQEKPLMEYSPSLMLLKVMLKMIFTMLWTTLRPTLRWKKVNEAFQSTRCNWLPFCKLIFKETKSSNIGLQVVVLRMQWHLDTSNNSNFLGKKWIYWVRPWRVLCWIWLKVEWYLLHFVFDNYFSSPNLKNKLSTSCQRSYLWNGWSWFDGSTLCYIHTHHLDRKSLGGR